MHCPLPSLESPSFGVKMGKHGGSVEQDEPQVSPDRNVSLLTCDDDDDGDDDDDDGGGGDGDGDDACLES